MQGAKNFNLPNLKKKIDILRSFIKFAFILWQDKKQFHFELITKIKNKNIQILEKCFQMKCSKN